MTAVRKASAALAEKVLKRLLLTPKTRAGLIAAVRNKDISENFVFGFLSEKTRSGLIAVLKSTHPPMYQLSECVVEKPADGTYPAWLEPRALPHSTGRQVFLDGVSVDPSNPHRKISKKI